MLHANFDERLKTLKSFYTPETITLSDLDGTAMELLFDPKLRRIDPYLLAAWRLQEKHHPNSVIPITARDYTMVEMAFGGKPDFSFIGSNGGELFKKDGSLHTHQLSEPQKKFLNVLRRSTMTAKEKYPEMIIEVKTLEVGFHTAPNAEYKDTPIEVLKDRYEKFGRFLALMETRSDKKGLGFKISSADTTHKCLSCADICKSLALSRFSAHLPTLPQSTDLSRYVFFGDTVHKGNDRDIAEMMNNNGGKVVQVTNGDFSLVPPKGDPARPHLLFHSPAELGFALKCVMEDMYKEKVPEPILPSGYRPFSPQQANHKL